jgi:hypothetical protein
MGRPYIAFIELLDGVRRQCEESKYGGSRQVVGLAAGGVLLQNLNVS